MTPNSFHPAANVLGIAVDALDMPRFLNRIDGLLHGNQNHYICVADVHGVMEAQRDPQLFEAYAHSAMTVPDGMPLVWTGWFQNHHSMAPVSGPKLMLEIFGDPRFKHLRHFFYGGISGVAEKLQLALGARFPGAQIVGTYTPPFRELFEDELETLKVQLATAHVDVLWIGISCPRQELFMARHIDQLPARLMFGVGAAFDYHTGRIRDCAPWVKHAGLGWLHRLVQDPKRLWKRYARTVPAFIWHMAAQVLRDGFRRGRPDLRSTARHQRLPATRH